MPVKKSDLKTTISKLGPLKIENPLPYCRFVDDKASVRIHISEEDLEEAFDEQLYLDFEQAGPREKIYFDPSKTKVAIVTCGGLCPGVNDVIRSVVMEGYHHYNIASCLGIRFGLQGFIPSYGHDYMDLTPKAVADIHQFGGTILGTSRGPQSVEVIVDSLERMNVNILFIIGGDGTMRAAQKINAEIAKRKLKMAIIGIPKTIDNDINFVTRSFGFDSAVEKATESISCAHTEAVGALNGIGMVKVMGRESGFIAAHSTLALKEVNYVLVPEDPFELHGEFGLLPSLRKRLNDRKHAVIVVAEGAGQHLCDVSGKVDASGNPVLGDICGVLISEIKNYFKELDEPLTLKFIDPSYIIRSIPANSTDRVYCGLLGQHAMHAAMAGRTGMVVTKLQERFVHLPFNLVTSRRKKINIRSDYWRAVLESTGQRTLSPIFARKGEACELD